MKRHVLVLALFGCTLSASAWTGDGTQENPYLLSSEEDLALLRESVNGDNPDDYQNRYFALTRDIELTEPWTPIGLSTAFKGNLDGRGFGVGNVRIGSTAKISGFFASISDNTISNFRILGGSIAGDSIVGGVVGYARHAVVHNCANAADVSGKCQVGGVVGNAYASVVRLSFNMGAVSSGYAPQGYNFYAVGGVVAFTNGGTEVNSCYNVGAVRSVGGTFYTGGVAGDVNDASQVRCCYNVGRVAGQRAGALLGIQKNCIVDSCYADAQFCPGLLPIANTDTQFDEVKNVPTKELTGKGRFGLFHDNADVGRYSHYALGGDVLADPLVRVASAAAVLADGETVDAVAGDFTVGDAEVWSCGNHKVRFLADGTAAVNVCKDGVGTAPLTVKAGGFERSLTLSIVNRCVLYAKEDNALVDTTVCASELPLAFADRAKTEIAESDFDFAQRKFTVDTALVFATVDGCDSVVPYRITCYPLPTAKRSDDMAANPIKVIKGNSLQIVYELDGANRDFSFETADGTPYDHRTNPIFSFRLNNITEDTAFYLKSLSCTYNGHTCDAAPEGLADTIRIKAVDEVDIAIECIGQGTMTDTSTLVPANGKQPKAYLIEPAAGWRLAKLENNLDEYEIEQVYVAAGGLRYAFTPTKDTKLTATFTPVTAWDGSVAEPIGGDTILVYAPDELAWVADQANNQSNGFAGKTVILKNDLDMAGRAWTAIGTFVGVFDANCKTVANVQQLFAPTAAGELIGFHLNAGKIESEDKTVESDYAPITVNSVAPLSGGTNGGYVWHCNGTPVAEATGETYTIEAGLAAGVHVYTRHATGGCEGDPTQAIGEYRLTVNAPESFEIRCDFNVDGGTVSGDNVVAAKAQCRFDIEPNDGFYLASLAFNGTDLLDSVYVEGGHLKLAFTPQAAGTLEVKFGTLPAWDGTARRPFMTRDRDSLYIYIPHELAWVAQQFAPTPTPNPAPARAPYTRDDVDWTIATVILQENLDCGGVCDAKYNWSGAEWQPIGTSAAPFAATFDGQNHEIRNLYINAADKDYLGLFGVINSSAELKNFAVTFGSITGGDYVGGVVGRNGGTISHCYNMCEISKANRYVGGIAGYNEGTIEYVYNVGLILEADEYAGGIAGLNTGSGVINRVYGAADVWSGKIYGALVGGNDGQLANSFWDNQMSAKVTGDGKTPASTIGSLSTTGMDTAFAKDNAHWLCTKGLYPQLVGLDGTNAALVSVTPVFLYNLQNAHAVKHDFNLGVQNGVAWTTTSTNWLDINGDVAKILYDNCYGTQVFVEAKLGDDIKRAKVDIKLDGDFRTMRIETQTDSACSVGGIRYIEGVKPEGGNSDTYVYEWRYTVGDDATEHVAVTDTIFNDEKREYKPAINTPGTYHFYRYAKDNACEQNYLKSDGVWTLVLLPEFKAGEIKRMPFMALCDASQIPTLADSIPASGGDGNISYRWTMDGNPIDGAAAPDYTPTVGLLGDNLPHTFQRQAKDGKCNEWTNSGESVAIQLLATFDAGSVKPVAGEPLCIDGDQATLQAENENAASGGDGNYSYRWQLLFSDKDGATLATKTDEEHNAAGLNYVFDKSAELPSAGYPIFVTITREAKDGGCHDFWTPSGNAVSYIIARNEAFDTAISVCERDFPYTYEYTYNATAKGTARLTFDKPGDVRTIADDETEWGCARTVTITANATPTPQVAVVDSLLEVCEGESGSGSLFVKVEALAGNPTKYKLIFDDNAFASVTEYTDIPADRIIPITPTGTPQPRIYSASLFFLGGTSSCESEAHRLEISVSLDGYLHQKWNDVIVVNNSGTLPGKPLTFLTYQWYRDGQKVDGATLQHIYEPDGLSNVYYAVLMAADGTRYRTCDFHPQWVAEAPSARIKVYPVPARQGQEVAVELPFAAELLAGGSLEICNAQGVQVYATSRVGELNLVGEHFAQGIYLVRFVDGQNTEYTTKFIVK